MSNCWHGEPSLTDVLQDPIVRMLMARDQLDEDVVRAELHASAHRLRSRMALRREPGGTAARLS